MYILAFDVGGTKIEGGLLQFTEDEGENDLYWSYKNKYINILYRKRVPTEREKGYQHILETIAVLGEEACREAGIEIEQLKAICLGLPGSVNPRTQLILNGNTRVLTGKPLSTDLKMNFKDKVPVYCANDANCFALAEVHLGVGEKYKKEFQISIKQQIAVGIILGTGVGGGLIINGNYYTGKDGGGAEFGHTLLQEEGLNCFCGRRGCAERYLSGPGLEQMAIDKFEISDNCFTIFQKANEGDQKSLEIIRDYVKNLTTFLLNLSNAIDPHYFVLGGGLSNQALIYKGVEESIAKDQFIRFNPPKVFQNKLGDSAGMYGAALLPFL